MQNVRYQSRQVSGRNIWCQAAQSENREKGLLMLLQTQPKVTPYCIYIEGQFEMTNWNQPKPQSHLPLYQLKTQVPRTKEEKQVCLTAENGVFIARISTVIVSITQVKTMNTNICSQTFDLSRVASAISLKKITR